MNMYVLNEMQVPDTKVSGTILIRAAAAPSEVSSNIDREDNYKFKTLLHKHLSEIGERF